MTIRCIKLVGSARTRGQQHGAQLQAEIQALYAGWLECGLRQRVPVTELEFLTFVTDHVAPAQAFAPHWVEEIEGIGEASGLGFERAFALSCWDELCSWFAAQGDGGRGAGCTSFALRPPASSAVMIGQNQDAWRWWRPVIVLHEEDPTCTTPAALYASHPGVLGALGINEFGIGLVANSLLPADRAPGVPFALVMREALAQRSLADAMGVILEAPRATGANYVLASTDGAVDIETTHSDAHVEYVVNAFTHSNHYLSERFVPLERGGAQLPDTYLREGRMRMLLAASSGSPVGVKDTLALLSDHEGAPTSICRHPAAAVDDMETLAASIVVPCERSLYMTDGPPCCAEVQRFTVAQPSVVEPVRSAQVIPGPALVR